MFVVPAIGALLVFVYFRPHDIFEILKPLSFNLIAGLLAWGYVMDVKMHFVRPRGSALLWLGSTFFAFCLFSHAVKASPSLPVAIPVLGAALLIFLLVSQGLPTFKAVEAVAAVILTITLAIAAIGVHQALAPLNCFSYSQVTRMVESDGRTCEDADQCLRGGAPDVRYLCEHGGLFNTISIQGRVRYRGILQDPNELAWAVCMGAPLAFALYQRKRSKFRLMTLIVMVVLCAICVIKTQSRAGQLTFAAMMAVYFIRRYKWPGAIAALVAAAPVMVLGGRTGDSASASTEERLECWRAGFKMLQSDFLLGVGHAQFTEHHILTAHSSLVLTLAELGPLGFFLWTAVMYFAFKIVFRVQFEFVGSPQTAVAQTWSTAVLASLTGTLVSALFLSIPYHPILWIDVGLTGALYAAIRQHNPDFHVRFGRTDIVVLVVGDILIATSLYLYCISH
jgi:hypothetical protein